MTLQKSDIYSEKWTHCSIAETRYMDVPLYLTGDIRVVVMRLIAFLKVERYTINYEYCPIF